MEDRLKYKTKQLKKAVNDLGVSLTINTNLMAPEVIDTIKSGQVQKFEVVVDLLWKTLKIFLYEINGIIENSPKKVIKKYFQIEECEYSDYEWLIKMINMRNELSHIYDSEKFEQIHSLLNEAFTVIKRVVKKI
ncbi:MAG: nucleotidyltransferase substrate binding protein [Desulfobacula sp.]|uniref:HI0074 family nucleotidyltransferase substrate-binding subunit n=1 Tax=Desulfobacula sp. TaxID=2593537 RepID=UPI0025C51D29|nr:HI0074 family nucleotidyltransferase substrate-binding subunit [Desulfobacula sp.]MCD4722849.1 nucleotidyltransferase substrate binding protein [Desulfobacula sp.]